MCGSTRSTTPKWRSPPTPSFGVIAVDQVPERLRLAEMWGAETNDFGTVDDVTDAIRELTDARGVDSRDLPEEAG